MIQQIVEGKGLDFNLILLTAVAGWPIFLSLETAISSYSLILLLAFQIDNKKSNDMLAYLSLPSMSSELDKDRGDKDKNNKVISRGPYTLAKNNSFQISTLACSTKLTHNGKETDAYFVIIYKIIESSELFSQFNLLLRKIIIIISYYTFSLRVLYKNVINTSINESIKKKKKMTSY